MARRVDDEHRYRGWGLHGYREQQKRTIRENHLRCSASGSLGDAASLQKSSASIIQRYTGISPWWSAVLFFPLAIVFSGIVYLCSQRREQLLRQEGKAEIYRISRKDDEYEVSFALGTKQGVHAGSVLTLLDKTGVPVGSVTVKEAYKEDATAMVSSDCSPVPGFIVALP